MIWTDLVCVASGPSLVASDCEMVRKAGVKVVAVNNSWEMAPFCNYLYAGDLKWWNAYNRDVTDLAAEKWTCSRKAHQAYGINLHTVGGGYNSGMRAIQFGITKGFKNIALLGYDCSLKKGIHWHGSHSRRFLKNPDALKLRKWHTQFGKVAKNANDLGVKIVNCSRDTELTCFDTASLERVLDGKGDRCGY